MSRKRGVFAASPVAPDSTRAVAAIMAIAVTAAGSVYNSHCAVLAANFSPLANALYLGLDSAAVAAAVGSQQSDKTELRAAYVGPVQAARSEDDTKRWDGEDK